MDKFFCNPESFDASNLMLLLCGGCLFLFGIKFAEKGLRKTAGARIRQMIQRLTGNRFLGVFVGIVITLLNQSSSATTVLLIGLTSAGFMALPQTLGVILGADIGTTLTVQLFAFNFQKFSTLMISAGFLLFAFGQGKMRQSVGQLIMGVGLIFFSMKIMTMAAYPLQHSAWVQSFFAHSGAGMIKAVLLSALITSLIHSSAAVIAIVMAFTLSVPGMNTPLISDVHIAMPLILGANIGNASTALIASLNAEPEAKRVAWAHFFHKIIGTLILLPLLGPFCRLVALTSANVTNQVANAHTLFNLFVTLVFLPFLSYYARFLSFLFKFKKENKNEFKPLFINKSYRELPILAMGQTAKEILRMGEIVNEMLDSTWQVIMKQDEGLMEKVLADDDRVDALHEQITPYLMQINQNDLPPELDRKHFQLLVTNTLVEQVGDIVSKNLMPLSEKVLRNNLEFSAEGHQELKSYTDQVVLDFKKIINAIALNQIETAREVITHRQALKELHSGLQLSHFSRLHRGVKQSLETTAVHMDYMEYLKRINELTVNIAKSMLKTEQVAYE